MKDELQKNIDDIYLMLKNNAGWLVLQGERKKKYESLIADLSTLEQGLNEPTVTNQDLYIIKRDIHILESNVVKFREYSVILPYIAVIYFGCAAIFLLITIFDVPKFISDTIGVNAPEKLISFGIAGALLYLATNIISRSKDNSKLNKITDFSVRILLAILVPIVLVALLFSDNGELVEFKITPEIISFACGYSANLVVEIMNKFVEKISQMIKSI